MSNPELVELLMEGSDLWDNAEEYPADLVGASLVGANLSGVLLTWANLSGAKLNGADLTEANLGGANLSEADLCGADLGYADLTVTVLKRACIVGADLQYARLIQTDIRGADLTGCRVYGASVWDVQVDEHTKQQNLIITPPNQPEVSVDNLEIAQFVYLLLNNPKIRNVIDTIGKKAVLILGRFTDERKVVLDAIRDALRQRGYVPMLFDFEGPESRDVTETVSTLAHLARFVIADLTDAKSIPQELSEIVPHLPSVPVQALILRGQREYGMFEHFKRYPWVLPIHEYTDTKDLIEALDSAVIGPAEDLAPNSVGLRRGSGTVE